MALTTLRYLPGSCAAVMDAVVAARYGPLLWATWGDVLWARIPLLLLAGALTFTLMDIWSRTISQQRPRGRMSNPPERSPVPATGGANV